MIALIYFGTSSFAVPALRKLARHPELFRILAVVTQSQKPVGREQSYLDSPVAIEAKALDLTVLQPEKLKTEDFLQRIKTLAPDVGIVASYGKILPDVLLHIPRLGMLNLHPSLLPKYRGPTPLQTAILNGDIESGVTLMKLDTEIDHGPIIAQESIILERNETTVSFEKKAAEVGAQLLVTYLPRYIATPSLAQEQDHANATFTSMLSREDGLVHFSTDSTRAIERKFRAYTPWPGIYFVWQRKSDRLRIKILNLGVDDSLASHPHAVSKSFQKNPLVSCTDGAIELIELQPEGKKPMSGSAFLNGYPDFLNADASSFIP